MGYIVITVLYRFDKPTLITCTYCEHTFDEIPAMDSVCPGCKEKIGQIEIL